MGNNTFQLAYGKGKYGVSIADGNLLGVYNIQQQKIPKSQDEGLILKQALANPIGTAPLRELAHPGDRVAIITSDLTRPCPSDRLLPPGLSELESAGIPKENIIIVLSLGLHRPMTEEEIDKSLSPEIRCRYQVINHDPNDTVHLGETLLGTPVEIFRLVVEADLRVCLANLEFHWFAGYSGGAKAIIPGVASRATVTANHTMLVQPNAVAGVIDGNPLRADLEEGVAMLDSVFILNVVVDSEHHILGAVAGDVIAAHRAGCEDIAARGKVKVPCKGDIVIASVGGYPKDINLYQAHKGLESASYFVRDGGILILVAECCDGIGNKTFESWMLTSESPQVILKRIQSQFVLGGHKAAAIAAILARAQVFLVSALQEDLVRQLFLKPFNTPQAALDRALEEMAPGSQVIVLPQAISTLPDFG